MLVVSRRPGTTCASFKDCHWAWSMVRTYSSTGTWHADTSMLDNNVAWKIRWELVWCSAPCPLHRSLPSWRSNKKRTDEMYAAGTCHVLDPKGPQTPNPKAQNCKALNIMQKSKPNWPFCLTSEECYIQPRLVVSARRTIGGAWESDEVYLPVQSYPIRVLIPKFQVCAQNLQCLPSPILNIWVLRTLQLAEGRSSPARSATVV